MNKANSVLILVTKAGTISLNFMTKNCRPALGLILQIVVLFHLLKIYLHTHTFIELPLCQRGKVLLLLSHVGL